MLKKDLIFLIIVTIWLLMIFIEMFFIDFMLKYGQILNFITVFILFVIVFPKFFSSKYNNWLESKLKK